MADGKNSYNCSEDSRFPSADNYLYFYDNILYCSEGTDMKKPPKIPTLCACGCNRVVWNGGMYVHGHNTIVDNPSKYPSARKKISQKKKGVSPSKEHSKKISNTLKGRKLPLEHKNKVIKNLTRSAWKGKKQPTEMVQKRSASLKGHASWSKGRVVSEETKKKMSEANSGKNNPFFGRKHSAETKKKISDNNGLKNPDVRSKISGNLSHAWIDGRSFLPYCNKFNKELKERIRERDNKTCQLCGERENGSKLSVHHVHYDRENCNPDLILLCRSCNTKVNTHRDYWEVYFTEALSKRGLLIIGDNNDI